MLRERCRHLNFAAWIFHGDNFLLPHRLGAAIFHCEVMSMETRVAVMSIIVENPDSVEKLTAILHEFGEYIIGRMGIPYRKRKISIISVALDVPQNTISSLAGKMGSLPGVSVKTAYSGIITTE
jgi:putative iron-only hydrogenase system regulator